ncbi:hypothetical protein PseBG33_2192 [Pseudomonas synxantha BG33R]|uniref:hypothetical protein n=1 Tax=Pseudomonas synxantha TaxID=47883 RepID=UPI00025FEEC2|nr:hypothetical protein [Pseudomonas synxantha]EIK69205.1 hypothetical protein PseBG33_2192 [Pseudomonas synxantha BG33R]
MRIKDIRTHDWFGLSDADTNIDPKNLSQPVYSVQPSNLDKAKKLMADIANSRVTLHKDLSSDEMSAANPFDPKVCKIEALATPIYINNHYDNLGSDVETLYRVGRSLGASNKIPDPEVFAEKAFYVATWATKYEGKPLIQLRKPVSYFEVWNEPDLGDFYNGTAQVFMNCMPKQQEK